MTTLLFADRLAEYEIPVFEVRPGIIKTPMTEVVTQKYDKLIAEGITPIRRWERPRTLPTASVRRHPDCSISEPEQSSTPTADFTFGDCNEDLIV